MMPPSTSKAHPSFRRCRTDVRAARLMAGLVACLAATGAQAEPVLSDPDFPTSRVITDGILAYEFKMKELHYRPVQKDLVFLTHSAGREYLSGLNRVDIRTGARTVLARTCDYPIDPNCDAFLPNQVSRMAVRQDGWMVLSIGQNQFTGFPTYVYLYAPDGQHDILTMHDWAPDYLGAFTFDRLKRFHLISSYSLITNMPPLVVGTWNAWYEYATPYAYIPGSASFQARAFTFGKATTRMPEGRPFVAMSDGTATGAGVIYELGRDTLTVRATGIVDPRWMAIDPITQDIFVATADKIVRISEQRKSDPPTVIAEGFHKITGLTFDGSGNLYVADHDLRVHETNTLLRYGEILVLKRAGVQLEVGLSDRTNPPAPLTDVISDKVVKDIHLPLGAGFFMRLRDKAAPGATGTPLPATYTVGQTIVTTMPPLPYGDPLFPFTVALMFGDAGPLESRNFFATHVGTALVDVTPRDTSIKPFKVRIHVYSNPAGSLGDSHPEVDVMLSEFAHRRGMPPFMLKGQMSKESGFSPGAYRYEPVSQDLYRFSSAAADCAVPRGRREILSEAQYSAYAIGVAGMGADVVPLDRSFRTVYNVSDPCNGRPQQNDPVRRADDTEADDQCTADNFYRRNPGQNWGAQTTACWQNAINRDAGILDFPAQTSLAASYGYFQMLYLSARELFRWPGVQDPNHPTRPGLPVYNPSYLPDTPRNLQLGGGTTTLATGYVKTNWVRINGSALSSAPAFATLAAFKQTFTPAFQAYNSRSAGYGARVMARAENYLPQLTLPVF